MKYVADDGRIYSSIAEAEKADKEFANAEANKELKENKLKKAKEDFDKATAEYKEAIKIAAEKFEKAQNDYLKIRRECGAKEPSARDTLFSLLDLLNI